MKRLGALLAALSLLGAAAAPVGSSLDRFRYQPSKIRVGEVAHYVKSNLDGTKPTRVSIFVVAPDRLEVAKVERETTDAAWVRAHFDWTLFTSDGWRPPSSTSTAPSRSGRSSPWTARRERST